MRSLATTLIFAGFAPAMSSCSGQGASSVQTALSISGTVSGVTEQVVIVALTGDATDEIEAGNSGNYTFDNLQNGDYVVTPLAAGYIFKPGSSVVLIRGVGQEAVNFEATPLSGEVHAISGIVSGSIAKGVKISLTGTNSSETLTDDQGSYRFPELVDGNYLVTPQASGHSFEPPWREVPVSGSDCIEMNFAATAEQNPTYSISGTISGDIQSGVPITASGGDHAIPPTESDSSGSYSFAGLSNGTYTITPVLNGYRFDRAEDTSVTVSGANRTGIDFKAVRTRFLRTIPEGDWPIVEDRTTGLIWQGCVATRSGSDCQNGSTIDIDYWQSAVDYCASLQWSTCAKGWRLPALDELESIVDSICYHGTVSEFPQSPCGLSVTQTWSSTLSEDGTLAWLLVFNNDFAHTMPIGSRYPSKVRCVCSQ